MGPRTAARGRCGPARARAAPTASPKSSAWRIDGYLADNPTPPAGGRPYEPAAAARERLALVAAAALGPGMSALAQAGTAWPALLAALRRAETAGHDAGEMLASAASERELRTAPSISEVLAWRISRYLAAQPRGREPRSDPASEASLARLASPSPSANAWTRESPVTWTRPLASSPPALTGWQAMPSGTGPRGCSRSACPRDPATERQWLRHVAVIAAYRDQHKITSDDPRQVLGPYPESGRAGHKAYWHAAESVLAARRLAGLDAPAVDDHRGGPGSRPSRRRHLPRPAGRRARRDQHRDGARLGPLWFGDRTSLDENAATKPAHAATLANVLARLGHLTGASEPARVQFVAGEPLEADFARKSRPSQTHPPKAPACRAPAPAVTQRLEAPPRRQQVSTPAPRQHPT